MKTVGLLVFLTDIHSLGLKNTEGMQFTTSWYWDQNDATRKFGERFFAKTKRMPTSIQAADYSAVTSYLKAVQAVKSDRKSTRLNSSHLVISYAVFCLKKKQNRQPETALGR